MKSKIELISEKLKQSIQNIYEGLFVSKLPNQQSEFISEIESLMKEIGIEISQQKDNVRKTIFPKYYQLLPQGQEFSNESMAKSIALLKEILELTELQKTIVGFAKTLKDTELVLAGPNDIDPTIMDLFNTTCKPLFNKIKKN